MEEAPLFTPSAAEFEDPLRYISSIRTEAERFGICRIQPPEGWEVPLALHALFRFPTRVQTVTELQQRLRSGRADQWKESYTAFLASIGERLPKPWPSWGGVTLDLWALSDAVMRRGGYLRVCEEQRWREVVRSLQAIEPGLSAGVSASFSLRTAYEKYLLQFELFTSAEAGLPIIPSPLCTGPGAALLESSERDEDQAGQGLGELHTPFMREVTLEADDGALDEVRPLFARARKLMSLCSLGSLWSVF